MKKALSALLVAALVLVLAVPAAFAVPETDSDPGGALAPATATLYQKPAAGAVPAQSNFVDVENVLHTGCTSDDGRLYWDTVEVSGTSYLSFLPQRFWVTPPTGLDQINFTYYDELMRLVVYPDAPLEEEITVTVYSECLTCKMYWTIDVTIVPEVPEDEKEMGLFEILASWWFDLKWTWDYQIHPFFKYIYFNTWGWIVSAWNLLCNAISNLFNGLIGSISG